jgi:hypothetical protein
MSRLWAWGTAVEEVALTDDLVPLGFTWLQQRHVVLTIDNAWEINQWADGIVRQYFRVTTHTQLSLDLFRDCLTNAWFVQRLHD